MFISHLCNAGLGGHTGDPVKVLFSTTVVHTTSHLGLTKKCKERLKSCEHTTVFKFNMTKVPVVQKYEPSRLSGKG